jgi:hypothetical protein
MVWRTTTRVGCALHRSRRWDFLICRYAPPAMWSASASSSLNFRLVRHPENGPKDSKSVEEGRRGELECAKGDRRDEDLAPEHRLHRSLAGRI